MAERPILFSGEMVRAILDGRKTQTRRVITSPNMKSPADVTFVRWQDGYPDGTRPVFDLVDEPFSVRCPYGVPGDRLWVRETWSPDHRHVYPCVPIVYRADRDAPTPDDYATHQNGCQYETGGPRSAECLRCAGFRWRPSIHMPRWASRLTLRVTDVRVEMVRDISEDDARAEGARWRDAGLDRYRQRRPGWSWLDPHPVDADPNLGHEHCLGSAQSCFGNLWNACAKPGLDWIANPWVWVVSFVREEPSR